MTSAWLYVVLRPSSLTVKLEKRTSAAYKHGTTSFSSSAGWLCAWKSMRARLPSWQALSALWLLGVARTRLCGPMRDTNSRMSLTRSPSLQAAMLRDANSRCKPIGLFRAR